MMSLNKVVIAVIVLGTANAFSMPSKIELTEAQPLVNELLSPLMEAFNNAGAEDKLDADVKIGDSAVEFAKSANTEAVRFLLFKGAVGYYACGEAYDKAADALVNLQGSVKDVPAAVIAGIAGRAVEKVPEASALRLYAIYRKASVRVRAEREVKTLAAKLKKIKTDSDQCRYAEVLAVLGNWKSAYVEFANVSNAKLKSVVRAEALGKVKNAVAGEFWWLYEPVFKDADVIFKEHAAVYYRKALEGGEIDGLKKTIVEQRLASLAGGASMKNLKVGEVKEELPVEETSESEQEDVPVKSAEGGRMSAGSVLSGVQNMDEVVLDDVRRPYVIDGQYIVPSGKLLTISAGVTIVFNNGSGIFVSGGSFFVNGQNERPVVFKGKAMGTSYWAGLKGESTQSFELLNVVVRGAKDAVLISNNGKATITSSVFIGNERGVVCSGRYTSVQMEQCIVERSSGDGVSALNEGRVNMVCCTIRNNFGWGVRGHYYGCSDLTSCEVTRNKGGGVYADYYDCVVNAENCIVHSNLRLDVKNTSGKTWSFSNVFWGDTTTKVLKAAGGDVNLKTIHDVRDGDTQGLVDISGYLDRPPADCGAKKYPKY